jgi:hypothetical protein
MISQIEGLPGQRNSALTWLLEASFLKVENDAG